MSYPIDPARLPLREMACQPGRAHAAQRTLKGIPVFISRRLPLQSSAAPSETRSCATWPAAQAQEATDHVLGLSPGELRPRHRHKARYEGYCTAAAIPYDVLTAAVMPCFFPGSLWCQPCAESESTARSGWRFSERQQPTSTRRRGIVQAQPEHSCRAMPRHADSQPDCHCHISAVRTLPKQSPRLRLPDLAHPPARPRSSPCGSLVLPPAPRGRVAPLTAIILGLCLFPSSLSPSSPLRTQAAVTDSHEIATLPQSLSSRCVAS